MNVWDNNAAGINLARVILWLAAVVVLALIYESYHLAFWLGAHWR